jgi:hypothetical protein
MADPQGTDRASEATDREAQDAKSDSNPFDTPYFLPVVLIAMCAWFVYAGWFNPDMEWIKFNKMGAGVTGILAIYFTFKATRGKRMGSGEES